MTMTIPGLESGRGQPHSKTLRDFRRVGGRASVLECGCSLPRSRAQKVMVIVRHYTRLPDTYAVGCSVATHDELRE